MLRFLMKPAYSFLLYFMLITFLVTAPDKGESVALVIFLFPWLLLVLAFVNLPFVMQLFRLFRMSKAKKINHALEHGTIYFLRLEYGKKARVGGRALADGFRLSGVKNKKDIRDAFKKACDYIMQKAPGEKLTVSTLCGSNIITAQGFGVVLLTLTAIVLLLFDFTVVVSLVILGFNGLIYLLLHSRLGNWTQGRYFISLDFKTAAITSVNHVKKQFLERDTVFYVKTIVHY